MSREKTWYEIVTGAVGPATTPFSFCQPRPAMPVPNPSAV
jgi:hypothetical protein